MQKEETIINVIIREWGDLSNFLLWAGYKENNKYILADFIDTNKNAKGKVSCLKWAIWQTFKGEMKAKKTACPPVASYMLPMAESWQYKVEQYLLQESKL